MLLKTVIKCGTKIKALSYLRNHVLVLTNLFASSELTSSIKCNSLQVLLHVKRYEGLKKLVESGTKTREELLLEDETPFELASIAIFKMMNDWQADGYEIPEPIQDVIYSRQGFIPAKQRLGWIRGSNMGFNAYQLDQQGRRKPITMPGNTEGKNPVAFLNEIRGNVEYVLLGMYGHCEENYSFTIGCNIEGVPYSGSGKTKKDAKKNCAMDVLSRLYRITV